MSARPLDYVVERQSGQEWYAVARFYLPHEACAFLGRECYGPTRLKIGRRVVYTMPVPRPADAAAEALAAVDRRELPERLDSALTRAEFWQHKAEAAAGAGDEGQLRLAQYCLAGCHASYAEAVSRARELGMAS